MSRWIRSGLGCLAALLLSAALAQAETPPGPAGALGSDLFVGGGDLGVRQPVSGDLIASGGSVDIDAPVAGDALAFAGRLRLGAEVARSLHAAAGQMSLNARIGRHARLAGGQVELGRQAEVGGNLSVAGGQVRLYGAVRGELQSAGGQLLIDGPVGGDVLALNARVELGPNARIAGKLRHRGAAPLVQDPAAQVLGGIELLPAPVMPAAGQMPHRNHGDEHRDFGDHPGMGAFPGLMGLVWTVGVVVVAGVLLATLPGFTATLARTLRERPGASLLLGFAWLVGLPVAAVLMFITVVGIPLGLFALAAYAALLPLALAVTAIGLGDWVLRRWLPARAPGLWPRIGASAGVLLLLALLGWVPGLGNLVGALSVLAGLGVLLLQLWPRTRDAAPAPGSTGMAL